MANEEHLAKLKEGVEAWNEWRNENKDVRPDLGEANLFMMNLDGVDFGAADLSWAVLRQANANRANMHEADLHGADIRGAKLVGVDLGGVNLISAYAEGAQLGEANLRRANLLRANFHGADLVEATLEGANLSWANLSEANLGRANLVRADLYGADLSGAILGETILGETILINDDLSQCVGLETTKHPGPSTISIDTIYKSNGNIPDVFLRGCGVPEDMIAYIHSIAGAIQFYSCFISYSSKDQAFAERLHADLQAKGVRVWFAPEDIQGGKKLHEQIDEAIRVYDKLLVVLSDASMDSEWVKTEIYHARQDEVRNKKRKLFPISLVPFENIRSWRAFDADVGKDMAREVREYFIPDFSNWKDHDAYQKAFDRLLRDLKASEETGLD